MKTYLKITFNSEGSKPSDIVNALEGIGFRPMTGWYDFIYEWGDHATIEDAIWFADKIHETLKGMNVYFQVETVGDDEENSKNYEE